MDRWKYFDITHRDHQICNPFSSDKLDELIAVLDLPTGARVLDIACGKAELLVRLAERSAISGVGVDLSSFAVRDARALVERRTPTADLTIVEIDGAAYSAEPGSVDAALCLGASWTFGGHRGALRALARWTRPGGLVVVGEPFWKQPPHPDYLTASGYTADLFATHAGNADVALEEGLTLLYAMVSDAADFDRYESLQWRAAERYAATHSDDPDVVDLLDRSHHVRDLYLRWGRDTLGWAVYVLATPR